MKSPLPTHAQSLEQCQNCNKSNNPPDVCLLFCSGCNRVRYCNRKCQTENWRAHKAMCQVTSETRAKFKKLSKQGFSSSVGDATLEVPGPAELEGIFRRWALIHRPTLQEAAVQALTLQVTPERCLTHVLSITLTINPIHLRPTSTVKSNSDEITASSFLFKSAKVIPYTEIGSIIGPEDQATLSVVRGQYAERFPVTGDSGGWCMVITNIENTMMTRMSPFAFEEKCNTRRWPIDPSWEDELRQSVARGAMC